jgi:hypothetical protein
MQRLFIAAGVALGLLAGCDGGDDCASDDCSPDAGSDAGTDAATDGGDGTDTGTDIDGGEDTDTGTDGAYVWHTFYGSASSDYGGSVAVDSNGNVYITGASPVSWTGPGGESPLHAYTPDLYNLFVLKLDPNGEYQWHTFYGPHIVEETVVVDQNGNVYVTGSSYSSWTGASGENPLHAYTGVEHTDGYNLFVLKLDVDGQYLWHTFFGDSTSCDTNSTSIAVDSSGAIYTTGTGSCYGGSSPNGWTGPQGESPLHAVNGGNYDLFVLKLDPSGAYQWHTFYGCDFVDNGNAVKVDSTGSVYVVGTSDDIWTGPSGETPLHVTNHYNDFFILKLNAYGDYQWHAFYGSSFPDEGNSVVVDATGDVYLAGSSGEAWVGPSGENPLHEFTSPSDLVVVKLSSNGSYKWHTFYDGSSAGDKISMAIDPGANVYITGASFMTWTGPNGENPLHAFNDAFMNVYVLKLSSNGTYQWHTFYGASSLNHGNLEDVAADLDGHIYVAGCSDETWTGPNATAPLHAHSGDWDPFVLKLAQ